MRTRTVLAITGIAMFGCISFSCGSGLTFLVIPHVNQAKAKLIVEGKDGDPVKNAKPANNKPKDEWNWQDLQDHLASKGWKTSRGQGTRGMWFVDGDGKPIERWWITGYAEHRDSSGLPLHDDGTFVAKEFDSAEIAKKGAAEFKDVVQRDVLAWNRYIFQGNPRTLAKLKKLLP